MNNVDLGYLFTSIEGRITRRDWWIGVAMFLVIALASVFAVSLIFGMFTTAGRVVLFILGFVFIYPQYCLNGKRFQDRNKPAVLSLIVIAIALAKNLLDLLGVTGNPMQMNALDYIFSIPLLIVGIWFLIELGCMRGTVGPNAYGPDPLSRR